MSNTFGSRSELFHLGKSFPKAAIKEPFMDWVPEIIEEDYRDFIMDHFGVGHKPDYKMNSKGKILRTCSCGIKSKEVKMLLSIYVFERIVHDSILNYLIKQNIAKRKREAPNHS